MLHFREKTCIDSKMNRGGEILDPVAPDLNVAILVTSGFSLLEVALVAETLKSCHPVSKRVAFKLDVFGIGSIPPVSGTEIRLSEIIPLDSDGSLEDLQSKYDIVFIFTGAEFAGKERQDVLNVIRALKRARREICATGSAVRLLMEQGIVDRATDHWSRFEALVETSDGEGVTDELFVTDCGVTTCAGQFALMDFLNNWISRRLSEAAARDAARQLISYNPRLACEKQPRSILEFRKGIPKTLRMAVEIMSKSMEDTVPVGDVAEACGVSVRQLERQFKRYLNCTPGSVYKSIRLERSLSLLSQTKMSVTEVAVACGFTSPSSFSKNFIRYFGARPSQFRDRV